MARNRWPAAGRTVDGAALSISSGSLRAII
jgi:hypothetical protein